MEPASKDFEPLTVSSQCFGRRLLTIGEDHLELFAMEMREERVRYPSIVVPAFQSQ